MGEERSGPESEALARFLERGEPAILTTLARVEGSAPRTEGTTMLVSPTGLHGTIGGGYAEFETIAQARAMLAAGETTGQRLLVLGPDSGQCCGGRLTVDFHRLTPGLVARLRDAARAADRQMRHVMLFGAGHVGKALAGALSPLPFDISVVETRGEELDGLPARARPVLSALPESEIARLAPGSAVVILTHDHALDFLIGREALNRDDLAYVGMIGSKTKRARFAGFWTREGGDPARLQRLVLPIGGSEVKDKRPAVIAALVAAELLKIRF